MLQVLCTEGHRTDIPHVYIDSIMMIDNIKMLRNWISGLPN